MSLLACRYSACSPALVLCSGLGMACIGMGLVVRLVVTFLLVHFGGFSLKEKVFIAVAWLPKATVQVCVPDIRKPHLLRRTGL